MAPVEAYRNQKYKDLKKQLLKDGILFTDPEFQPAQSSIYIDPTKKKSVVEWKRPGELVDNPCLFVDGVSVNDVAQGILGNCWFVSACSALTHNESLLNKVIPDADEQEWHAKKKDWKHAGIFHFVFWRFGKLVDVVVDDLLPTENGKLMFASSKTKNEFWSALLEKAFAKLSGCYEALIGGALAEALVDLSGGVPETIELKSETYRDDDGRVDLFYYLKEAFDKKSLIAAAITAKSPEEVEEALECGLVKGHSYAVTAVRHLELDAKHQGLLGLFTSAEKILMVRLQNPWGEKEWNGPWSDGSRQWELVTEDQKSELGLTFDEDGEFWMTWDDFCRYFTDVSVCHMINTSFFSMSKRFHESTFFGEWKAGKDRGSLDDRAGGCLNFKATCLSNPQSAACPYLNNYWADVHDLGANRLVGIDLAGVGEVSRFDIKDDTSEPVMISLTQQDIRERRRQGASYLTIGMHVMKVEDNRKYRLHVALPSVATSDYVNSRSIFLRIPGLKSGRYVMIPSTYAPGEEGGFMLRLFTPAATTAVELTKHKPSGGCCHCCRAEPMCVTVVKVLGGADLVPDNRSIDPYCIIKCDGKQVRSKTVLKTSNPTLDFWTIFVRRHVDKPIKIDVWDSNYLKDSFLGRVLIEGKVDNDSKKSEMPLMEKKKKKTHVPSPTHGRLVVEVASYDDPLYL